MELIFKVGFENSLILSDYQDLRSLEKGWRRERMSAQREYQEVLDKPQFYLAEFKKVEWNLR